MVPIFRMAAIIRSSLVALASSPCFLTTVSFASAVTARTVVTLPPGIETLWFSTRSPGRFFSASARLVADSFAIAPSSKRSSRSRSPSWSSSAAAVAGTSASPSLTTTPRLGPNRVTLWTPSTSSSVSGMAIGPASVMIVSSGMGVPSTPTAVPLADTVSSSSLSSTDA